MRALTASEIDECSGGLGWVAPVIGGTIGGAIGFAGAWYDGGSAGDIAIATALGAMSGLAGGIAGGGGSGLIRAGWGLRAVGYGFASSAVVSSGKEDDDS